MAYVDQLLLSLNKGNRNLHCHKAIIGLDQFYLSFKGERVFKLFDSVR